MWLVVKELVQRFDQHFSKLGIKDFKKSFSGSLPLQDYFLSVDHHFQVIAQLHIGQWRWLLNKINDCIKSLFLFFFFDSFVSMLSDIKICCQIKRPNSEPSSVACLLDLKTKLRHLCRTWTLCWMQLTARSETFWEIHLVQCFFVAQLYTWFISPSSAEAQ